MAFVKTGYGQVEPNHLSAMRTGRIYAQLPVASGMWATTLSGGLENGQFVKYVPASGAVTVTTASGTGEWMLVMNEIKLYEVGQYAKDFVMTSGAYVDGVVTPRVYATVVGDIITTNMLANATYAAGSYLTINANGMLEADAAPSTTEMVWRVIKETTMPDGSGGVKIQRVQ